MASFPEVMPALATSDLDGILASTRPLWEQMRGQKLFLTGGTGFFGAWLVESFLYINQALTLNAEVTVLTRSSEAYLKRLPHLHGQAGLVFQQGDVRDFPFPEGRFRFILHAATAASARQLADEPHQMLSTILLGTERVLSFAAHAQTEKLLFTSSGAVYGRQPAELSHVPEGYLGAPDPLLAASVYGEGKRAAELMCALAESERLQVKIARCFAFLGPHLPLDTHFAAGNFLRDALASQSISIASDGSSLRSYLYASDLAIWLWTMLFVAPSNRAYNVGSEDAVSIRNLAAIIARTSDPLLSVNIAQVQESGAVVQRYVPSTARAQSELGLKQTVSLEDGVRRTLAWHRIKSSQITR